jgi:hypothetical protein
VLLLLGVVPAGAQDRAYVAAVGGLTFQAETAGLFGAEAGFHVTRDLVVFAQGGRMLDVLPRSVRDDLDAAVETLEAFTGRPWNFEAQVEAAYFGGGIKYLLPTGTGLRPYIVAGIGGVNYKGSLEERELGDVLDQAIALGVVDEDDVRGTEVAYEVGGGISASSGRAQLDAGYRLMNVKGVNISRLAAAIGIRF